MSEVVTGTYVAVIPTESTLELLSAWAAENKIHLDPNLHVTTLYSRSVVNVSPCDEKFIATGTHFDMFGDCLVLRLSCPELETRHNMFMEQGGTHDYPVFNLHMTLQFKTIANLNNLTPVNFQLHFHREHTEALTE